MGLTVHFNLDAPGHCIAAQVRKHVMSLRRLALVFQQEGLVDRVHPIVSDVEALRRFARHWLILPVPGEENTSTGVEVSPREGFLFRVDVGQDCEPLVLGLCRYPKTVLHHGCELQTKLRLTWRLAGSCKTQYAGLHGWKHFQRCHCAVLELLAGCRRPGLRVKISDEGKYWPRRSLGTLRGNLDQMNQLVAVTAGALQDDSEAPEGTMSAAK